MKRSTQSGTKWVRRWNGGFAAACEPTSSWARQNYHFCLNTLVNGCIFQLSSHERRRALVRGLSFSNRLILQIQVLTVLLLHYCSTTSSVIQGLRGVLSANFLPPWDFLNFATCWEKEEFHLSITSTSKLGNQEYLWIVLQTSGWISIEEVNRGKH